MTECPDARHGISPSGVGLNLPKRRRGVWTHGEASATIKPNKKSTTEYEKVYEKAYSKLYGLCKRFEKNEEKKKKKKGDRQQRGEKEKGSDDTVSIDKCDDSSTLKIAPSLLAAPDHANHLRDLDRSMPPPD